MQTIRNTVDWVSNWVRGLLPRKRRRASDDDDDQNNYPSPVADFRRCDDSLGPPPSKRQRRPLIPENSIFQSGELYQRAFAVGHMGDATSPPSMSPAMVPRTQKVRECKGSTEMNGPKSSSQQYNNIIEIVSADTYKPQNEVQYLFEKKNTSLPKIQRKPLIPLRHQYSFSNGHRIEANGTGPLTAYSQVLASASVTPREGVFFRKPQPTKKPDLASVHSKFFSQRKSKEFTVHECYQLEEKKRYHQLLQQHTRASLNGMDNILKPVGASPELGPSGTISVSSGSRAGSTSLLNGALHRIRVLTSPKEDSLEKSGGKTSGIEEPIGKETKQEDCAAEKEVIIIEDDDPATSSSLSSPSLPNIDSRSASTDSDSQGEATTAKARQILSPRQTYILTKEASRNWLEKVRERYSSHERELIRKMEEERYFAKARAGRAIPKRNLEDRLETQMFFLDLDDYERKKEVEAQVQEELREIAAPKTTLPELTPEMKEKIAWALKPGPGMEVLSEGFKMKILRKDLVTLKGLSWLNDEVINFYMSMVAERGGTDGLPKAYAFSTFFYPKMLTGGQAALKRWTRRIDIFSYSLIIIPVHLGMHWCLAVVDFRDKSIRYFDSMGGRNDQGLQAILRYLVDESMDKKKVQFDTSDWRLINVPDIPHQGNGSDCGMFSCKYAEYVSRDAQITFTQQDMPYFRKRMVYEILTRKLISP